MDSTNTFLNINECKNCGLYITKKEIYLSSCFYCKLELEKEAAETFDLSFLDDEEELRENEEWFRC